MGILECSERLLLSELKPPTAAALVNAAGDSCLLLQRLEAVGLPSEGTALEKANRLLLLRTIPVKDMLRAASIGSPAAIASVVRHLPSGQSNAVKAEIAPHAL